jgi:hypothetical protein
MSNELIKEGQIAETPDVSRDKESLAPKRGRRAHLPDATTRKRVYDLSSVGTTYEDIATSLGISSDTLTKYYKDELQKGRIDANAIVAGTLFEQAREGNTSAAIFWLKTRARWAETTKHEVGGTTDGSPVNIKIITGID